MPNRFALSTAVLLALGTALLSSCSRNPDVQARNTGPEVQSVAVAEVKTATLASDLVLTAEFKPFQEIDVMAKVAGYVKSINVDIGDRVKQGQLLAVLEVPEMADDQVRAQSMLSRSEA